MNARRRKLLAVLVVLGLSACTSHRPHGGPLIVPDSPLIAPEAVIQRLHAKRHMLYQYPTALQLQTLPVGAGRIRSRCVARCEVYVGVVTDELTAGRATEISRRVLYVVIEHRVPGDPYEDIVSLYDPASGTRLQATSIQGPRVP